VIEHDFRKFYRKNNHIWSQYKGEKLVTSFNHRLKREITLVYH
jgi:hypothetical protein